MEDVGSLKQLLIKHGYYPANEQEAERNRAKYEADMQTDEGLARIINMYDALREACLRAMHG